MKKVNYLCFLLFIFFYTKNAIAQFPLFKNNDRVCFIGNSITMNGRFHNYIELFYATRFPDRKINFYNCGISGDVSGGILKRMDSDILIHKPNWSVLMIGMNDVNRSLYAKERTSEPGIKEKQKEALTRYFKNVDSVVRILIKANSKVILQTPSIYDQTAELQTPSLFGVNDALGKCTEFLKTLADKYKLPVVDYWTSMNAINAIVQKKDPAATIIGRDRVHPDVQGHFIMAAEFLKTQQVPAYVSYIDINAEKHKIIKTVQCNISYLGFDSSGISFACSETSLPYPLLSEDFNPDSLFLFTDNFNKEILQLTSLKKGNYALSVDSIIVGTYSEKEFNMGVNLATNILTPQYSQAKKVVHNFDSYWDLERKLRGIKYVEYGHLKGMKQFNDLEEIKKVLASNLEGYKITQKQYLDYYQECYDDYLKNKPMEKSMEVELAKQFDQIMKINKPVKHTYKIERMI
jgi:lysophospholipase L1-like esterase